MKHSRYNHILTLLCISILLTAKSYAQDSIPHPPKPPVPEYWNFKDEEFESKMREYGMKMSRSMKDLDSTLRKLNLEKFKHMNAMMADVGRKMENQFGGKTFEFFDRHQEFSDSKDVGAFEKSKTISKTYPANANDKLSINNQFGKVDIRTWAKNEFKVDILITVNESSEERAQELLNNISITDSKTGNLVSFKTNIEQNKNTGKGRKMQVDYTIFMPAKNALSVDNKFGGIILPDLDGPIAINSSYGSLNAQNLSNPENRIKVAYGSAKIQNLHSSNLNVSYGSLDLSNSGSLNADVSYSSAKIGKISGNAAVNLKYSGGFQIREIDPRVKDVNINASYSSVKLNFNPAANFDFDVTVSYAGFNYNSDKVKIVSQTPDDKRGFHPTKNYKGNYGKGADGSIIIKSNYGGVSFQ